MTDEQGAAVRIDRLALHAGAMSEAEARRLAELVALALARLTIQTAPEIASVDVPAQEGRSVEQIAGVVAEAIAAALRVEAAG